MKTLALTNRTAVLAPRSQSSFSRTKLALVCAAAASLAGPWSSALAGDVHWNVPSGSWNHVNNWSLGAAPGPNDVAFIAYQSGTNSGVARVASNVGNVARVEVRRNNTVAVVHEGVLTVTGDVNLGTGDGGLVSVSSNNPSIFNPATLNVGGHLRMGVSDGFGRVDQSADFVNVTGNVILGVSNITNNPGQPGGFYNLAGGRLNVGGNIVVGGDASGSHGTFELHAPAVANVGGISSNYGGFFHHLGGEMHVGQGGLVFPAANGGAFMRYTVHDGEFTSAKVTVRDAGEWEIRGGFVSAGRLAVNGGRVVISEPGPVMIHTLDVAVTDTVNGTGFIDLNEGGLTTNSNRGPADSEAVRVLIQRGYRDGLWTSGGGAGTHRGITSRAAGASVATPRKLALGYADTIQLNGGTLGAGPDGGSSIIVKLTLYGDANLDGAVNLQDFNKLAGNFGTSGKFWVQGDFNYDTVVNLQDFNKLAANFGQSAVGPTVTPQDWAALAGAVPEPSCAAPALTAFAAAAARLRRVRRAR